MLAARFFSCLVARASIIQHQSCAFWPRADVLRVWSQQPVEAAPVSDVSKIESDVVVATEEKPASPKREREEDVQDKENTAAAAGVSAAADGAAAADVAAVESPAKKGHVECSDVEVVVAEVAPVVAAPVAAE